MSLLAKVQAFIELNPGLTSNEIADAFPEYARFDVQRSASKLYRCKRVNRRLDGDVFRYYAGKDEAVILTLRHTTKQSSWASSLEGMNLQFLTHTLRPLLVNIEQEIGRCLLDSDDDVFAEFSVEGLLRADSAGRAAYYTSALQNGWMSRNDVRRLENMPPIEGGDIYTVQLNLTQLKNLESVNPAVQALAVRELHNHVFPDIPYEQSPLKQAA